MIKFIKNLFKKKDPPSCNDCKYMCRVDFSTKDWCGSPRVYASQTMKEEVMPCKNARSKKSFFFESASLCGPKAKYFEPKDL